MSNSSQEAEPKTAEASKPDDNETRAAIAEKTVRVKTPDGQTPTDATDVEEVAPEEPRPAAADRRTNTKRPTGQRPRRAVEPPFEQPSVSSIDAIMTGVPYDRRDRWADQRDQWAEEELRRREMRRIIRENRRRQQPF